MSDYSGKQVGDLRKYFHLLEPRYLECGYNLITVVEAAFGQWVFPRAPNRLFLLILSAVQHRLAQDPSITAIFPMKAWLGLPVAVHDEQDQAIFEILLVDSRNKIMQSFRAWISGIPGDYCPPSPCSSLTSPELTYKVVPWAYHNHPNPDRRANFDWVVREGQNLRGRTNDTWGPLKQGLTEHEWQNALRGLDSMGMTLGTFTL